MLKALSISLFTLLFHSAIAQVKLSRAGADSVYVYFGRHYFCDSTKTPWLTEEKRWKICSRINELEQRSQGPFKRAQSLKLWTDSSEQTTITLGDVKAKYTILCFWHPNSKKCVDEIAGLITAYYGLKKLGIDVQVFAAATMDSTAYDRWLEYAKMLPAEWINVCDVKYHSMFRFAWDVEDIKWLPKIYILDKYKSTKARRIAAEQVADYIHHLDDPAYLGKLKRIKED